MAPNLKLLCSEKLPALHCLHILRVVLTKGVFRRYRKLALVAVNQAHQHGASKPGSRLPSPTVKVAGIAASKLESTPGGHPPGPERNAG